MKYIDEFRNKALIKNLSRKIHKITPKDRKIIFMEVCGTHTQSFFRYGIGSLIPENIEILSGPGCPVCVSSQKYIDEAIEYSQLKDVIIATFGDMMRVPGTNSSLEKQKAKGADIRVVYSSLDALELAKKNPQKKVIFLAVGFETTIPTTALMILEAKKLKLNNFFVLCSHKLIPPAMRIIASDKKLNFQGFICPGHVSVITGSRPYDKIAKDFKIPCVVAGFEPLDLLESLLFLLEQANKKKSDVIIQYRRVVKKTGNIAAQRVISRVFDICDADWRGLGIIKKSGLKVKKEFSNFDAEVKIPLKIKVAKNPEKNICLCGEVLKGKIRPPECPSFAKICNPQNPLGPCMVSSEGTCGIYFRLGSRR
ncbi:MAG: hydrogenase formation protein HypD, partial [Candidatus Omnitrophica bacterium]|nr:hydrogenase formation protein HypD [Candidatus Omnitrophota bacterium]